MTWHDVFVVVVGGLLTLGGTVVAGALGACLVFINNLLNLVGLGNKPHHKSKKKLPPMH